MRAFSLITSMVGRSPHATTSPITSPSMRRPSPKRSSPRTTVPSPTSVRIGGCLGLPNMYGLSVLCLGLHGQGGSPCAAGIDHPDGDCLYHGRRRVIHQAVDAQILLELQRLGAPGPNVSPGLAVERTRQVHVVATI